jgi:UDP-glucose 4-epimerase
MGVEPQVVHLPARNEVVDAYSSHDKVLRVFGRRPAFTLDEGLGRMAAWVRQHGSRSSREFGHIEVEKNFPAAWRPQAATGAAPAAAAATADAVRG